MFQSGGVFDCFLLPVATQDKCQFLSVAYMFNAAVCILGLNVQKGVEFHTIEIIKVSNQAKLRTNILTCWEKEFWYLG